MLAIGTAVFLALALCADATVLRRDALPVTLPFARRLNMTGTAKLLELDQARAKFLKTRANAQPGVFQQGAIFNAPATNQAVDYTTTVSENGESYDTPYTLQLTVNP